MLRLFNRKTLGLITNFLEIFLLALFVLTSDRRLQLLCLKTKPDVISQQYFTNIKPYMYTSSLTLFCSVLKFNELFLFTKSYYLCLLALFIIISTWLDKIGEQCTIL